MRMNFSWLTGNKDNCTTSRCLPLRERDPEKKGEVVGGEKNERSLVADGNKDHHIRQRPPSGNPTTQELLTRKQTGKYWWRIVRVEELPDPEAGVAGLLMLPTAQPQAMTPLNTPRKEPGRSWMASALITWR